MRGRVWIWAWVFWAGVLGAEVHAAWPKPAVGARAMVASAHPLATEAGKAVLAAGGNAVDAAVAVSLALSVVEPWSSGLGGGGFAVVHIGGETFTLDMREVAPRAATSDMFLADGKVTAGESVDSARAAAIPGLVRGLALLHRRKGRLPFPQVVAPAIGLARDGFPASVRLCDNLAGQVSRMQGDARRIFMPNGRVPEVGERFVQAELGVTLQRIADSYGEDFYVGETAKALVAGVKALGGIWTPEDLAGYGVKERPAVTGVFRGHDIVSMGPPSSGGLLLVQMLGVLEGLPKTPWNGADRLHVLAELGKRAFAMRAVGLADPDFFAVDRDRFVGAATLARLTREVSKARRATPSKALSSLKVKADERTHTTHFAVLTADGDGVAMTQTINLGFGNGQVAGTTGVVLNNEMDDFAVQVGVPNAFGLVGDRANRVEPGKRPLSSMTPTLVLRDGKAIGAFGSPGGSRIISTTFQVLVHVIEDGMNPAEALGAPRVHHQWYPEHLWVEPFAVTPEVRAALERRGHVLHDGPMMGNAMAIWRRADGRLEGAADPRGEGSAAGL
jgi:gamma-glutamyltranspeptidase/glutathione hydrolase